MVVRGAWWVRYTAAQRIPNGHHRPFNGKVVRKSPVTGTEKHHPGDRACMVDGR